LQVGNVIESNDVSGLAGAGWLDADLGKLGTVRREAPLRETDE
jgi:hypothetical protein